MSANVITIPAFGDNFIYVHIWAEDRAFVVDPGESTNVLDNLDARGLRLTAILLTHRHWDHVGGVADLVTKTKCDVYAADRGLTDATGRPLDDGEVLAFGDARVRAIATPGHTRDALCYHVASASGETPATVYTGDTLFIGGCGRLLESDATTMWQSLCRLAALPDDTLVYCGHDYTVENYEFAVATVPDEPVFGERLAQVQKALEYGQRAVPSTIGQEKRSNIFLQAANPSLGAAVGMAGASPEEVFAELRRRKDLFG